MSTLINKIKFETNEGIKACGITALLLAFFYWIFPVIGPLVAEFFNSEMGVIIGVGLLELRGFIFVSCIVWCVVYETDL